LHRREEGTEIGKSRPVGTREVPAFAVHLGRDLI
jgi:hypothetical protein